MPLSGRILSGQNKSNQWGLHFSLLCWPVADPGRCAKNISGWPGSDPKFLVFLDTHFLRSPVRHLDEPCRGLERGVRGARVGVVGSVQEGVGMRGWFLQVGRLACRLASISHSSWQDHLVMPAHHSGAALKPGAQEQLPMGWLRLRCDLGASSGAGCPAGFDWLQLLVCSQLGCFWKACPFDLSASFLTLSFSSAASFPPCECNRGSLKSLCPLGFQVTLHLFNLSLKLNARTSSQKKKI